MRRKLSIACLSAIITALVAFAPEWSPFSRIVPTGQAQIFTRQPLYRFQSARGHYLYKTGATLPPGLSDGPWENEGIACHVPDPASHGTKPVYQLSKSDDIGVRYAFTSDPSEANAVTGWTNQGVVFYVATTKLPGTVPFYRLYKPLIPAKKKDTSIGAKITEVFTGPEFTESTAGLLQDTTFYTIDVHDRAVALNNGFVSQGILGYVWESSSAPPAATAPDLTIIKTMAEEFSVTAVVANKGTRNTSGASYSLSLTVFDQNNKLLFQRTAAGPGLSPNQLQPVKIDTGGQSLKGKRYQVRVDETDAIKESNEDNNESEMLPGPKPTKITVADANSTTSHGLGLDLRDRHERTTVGPRQHKVIDFDLAISNANVFPDDAYQPLTVLPPKTCGITQSNARLFANIIWGREGKDTEPIMRGTCIPLVSQQDLSNLTFSLAEEKGTASLLQVIVLDRLTGIEHKSNIYPVGAFGVRNALLGVGCKGFLGRADDFLCTSKQGKAACENLRQQGKPIKCRMAN